LNRIYIAFFLFFPGLLCAQEADLQLPISLDADSTDYDGKNSMMMFRGLRLSQGQIGVVADEGRASKLDFQDSVWRFEGNVVIDVENGHIECDTADLQFIGHTLRTATIEGSPATFELRRPGSDEVTYAEAGRLKYDLGTGIIEFSENAVITEGGNQISSSLLIYNIPEQRINAQSSGNGDEKVKITYTPVDVDAEKITREITDEFAEEIAEEIIDQTTEESGDPTQ
jgi:lipopolysaccharide transport protein LptA